ncbi:formyltetrahydrofolate deformylase [Marinomonas ostreistagni]|uniref:Formyltetrahydrofolate deformylase n=1 Tax=Marinomonas ostreistagni TaxID=359209 RepID=A0ABS0Z9Z3_9GAMM|nr:formyltetrahydrofolate deformylase [Marinomonas ostreistagni]MBJ7550467.1 formyltetrahydrofolate deformylase [Marinomonas ostreistagni]
MKLKLTPTQNLCVGFLETGFELIQVGDQYFFVKGKRRQKVLSKTLEALVSRGALKYTREGTYELSEEFKQHRKEMRSLVESKHVRH